MHVRRRKKNLHSAAGIISSRELLKHVIKNSLISYRPGDEMPLKLKLMRVVPVNRVRSL